VKLLLFFALAAIAQAESGSFTIHMILHAIGEERYEITPAADGLALKTTFEYTDRGNKRTTIASMRMKSDYTPLAFEIQGRPVKVAVESGTASVQEDAAKRSFSAPDQFFTIFGPSPFAIQAAMLRYWAGHGRPARLAALRANPAADPIEITAVGRDEITVNGEKIALERLTIANLMFGREIVWTDSRGELAAAMTFAGGLPMEAVRTAYEPAFEQLYRSGIRQEMANLGAIAKLAPPERTGTFAIVGGRLVNSNVTEPIADSVVIVRDGRILAAGARAAVSVPRGMPVIDAKGRTLLPGLWEMHTHYSGVEFGPALLASGITTARDCGGEFDYLVAQRDAIERASVPSPRLVLAGLVDAGGLKAFGHVTAETADEGRAVVKRYHDAGFQQIKLYTFLAPDVIRAIAAEAHRLGMTVTGHVPQAFDAFEGVEAGMDQINHLNYASNMMRAPGAARGGSVDVNSEAAQRAIQFFKDHRTVIDPTAGWGEMASHSKQVDVAAFEPGIAHAPFVLDAKFRGMGSDTPAEQMHSRMAQTLAVIGALHKGGVAIVPGSDTGLVGFGLHRELELYVQAGMTPLEAIQCATIASARAMNLERDTGSIEAGKRADLILVDGDPLANIADLRRVSLVIASGRVYDPAKLWKSVGFKP
jgi:imidazolonepropionase-like amidohydrolase